MYVYIKLSELLLLNFGSEYKHRVTDVEGMI